jgi:hypothetical protein
MYENLLPGVGFVSKTEEFARGATVIVYSIRSIAQCA